MQDIHEELQVAEWLTSIGLGDYGDLFIAHSIRWDVLPFLEHEDLEDIGISSVGHRLRIMISSKQLRPQNMPFKSEEQKDVDFSSIIQRLDNIERQQRRLKTAWLIDIGRSRQNQPLPSPVIQQTPTSIQSSSTGITASPQTPPSVQEVAVRAHAHTPPLPTSSETSQILRPLAPRSKSSSFIPPFETQDPGAGLDKYPVAPFKTFKLGKEDTTSKVAAVVHRKYGLPGLPSDYRLVVQYVDHQNQRLQKDLQEGDRVQFLCGKLRDQGYDPVLSLVRLDEEE